MAARDYLHKDDYEFLFLSQGGKCAICGTPQDELDKSLAVDHNHATMEVRGLLCSSCNLGLGMFFDDPRRLKMAIHYLVGNTGIFLTENPISYPGNPGDERGDWRKIEIEKDYDYILAAPVQELMAKYRISKATAYNWKSNIRLTLTNP